MLLLFVVDGDDDDYDYDYDNGLNISGTSIPEPAPLPVFSRPFTKNHAEYERITSDIIIKYSNWYLEFRAAPIHRCPAAGAGKPLSRMIF